MKIMVKLTAVLMAALLVFDACLPSVAAAGEEAVEVPEDVAGISEELGLQYSICPETIQAVCWVESRFDPEAENDGCTGIMQVSGKWHKDRMERLGVEDLKDTEGCMRVAVDYLAELVEDGEDMEAALMRYHGESRIRERLSEGELSEYVDKVLAVSAMLEQRNRK
ncbi:MAG: lytic transglycosylase domain-containing protein [Lachnospiraceae bacterium]|jgi:soluble lytic murein transglycosylase-like protein|nr:lytic transglycosylase domain-containing protein [Lachnospiraceae bacterium]